MPRETPTRPPWWEDWIPDCCPECGQPFVPTMVTRPWQSCDCPGTGAARGHEMLYCGRIGCHWKMWPPEHVAGSEEPERPRSF